MTASVVAVVAATLRDAAASFDEASDHYRQGWADRTAAAVVEALREAATITTVEQLDALPPEAIVKTEGGSVACRFYDGVHGVVFGDDRPFKWSALSSELPGVLLWHPEWVAVDGSNP